MGDYPLIQSVRATEVQGCREQQKRSCGNQRQENPGYSSNQEDGSKQNIQWFHAAKIASIIPFCNNSEQNPNK